MGTDIPLWIGGLQKWVTGVTKQTTCEDIIRAVLLANDSHHQRSHHRDYRRYAIVERWHKVERPLDSRSKLLKVWNTWGLEQCNVRFLLKRAHHAQTSTPRDVKSHRRKVGKASSKTWHPRKLRSESEDEASCCLEDHFPATEDQLRNLVASQNDALAAQLRKLKQKDEEIESFENEIHTQRLHQIGANYVIDTYLAENDVADNTNCVDNGENCNGDNCNGDNCNGDNDDGRDQPTSSPACDILDHCIELYENVLQICDQVHREEAAVKELTSRIQQAVRSKENANECRLLDDNPELAFAGPERLEEILNRTKHDIERLLRINHTQQLTINQNEQTLQDCTEIIEDKHHYLQHLKSDLDRLDRDNLRLQEEFSAIKVIPVDRIASCDVPESGDSNSDTGLSSMHSSDDGATVLDTLV